MENYVGKRLDGRYEIQEVIGVGGMAVVYKAYDNIDRAVVAVKVLKDEFLADPEFRRRFKNESKAFLFRLGCYTNHRCCCCCRDDASHLRPFINMDNYTHCELGAVAL